jgi:hypothetical protein
MDSRNGPGGGSRADAADDDSPFHKQDGEQNRRRVILRTADSKRTTILHMWQRPTHSFPLLKTPFGAHEIKVMHEIDCGDIAYANFIQRIITLSMIHCSELKNFEDGC